MRHCIKRLSWWIIKRYNMPDDIINKTDMNFLAGFTNYKTDN